MCIFGFQIFIYFFKSFSSFFLYFGKNSIPLFFSKPRATPVIIFRG